MQLSGTIKVINEEVQVSDKFKKRDFVLTDSSSQYPQHIALQLSQDKCELLDGYEVGDEITVQINLRGREWTSPQGEVKYFNTLDVWSIKKMDHVHQAVIAPESVVRGMGDPAPSKRDDLPF